MSSHQSAPVAIVGAGPVGQTTALLLARRGISSVLLDGRDHRDAIGSKAICQQRDVLDIWAYAGAGEQIAAEGVTWSRARTFHHDRELFCLDLSHTGWSPFPPFVNVSQSRTEEILDQQIAAEPLVEVRWGHEVTRIDQDADGVTLRTGGREIRAPYVVLACGARSTGLREQVGVTFDGHSFDDRFLICDIVTDLGDWAEERRFYFDPEWNPGRQVLIHPCPDSTYRIDWQVPADYDLEAEERSGALDRRIRQIIGDTPYEIVWKSVYRFHSRVASRMQVGRVLLAGDCAHLYSPFGARGLNSGVGDAENAAWKLAYVLHGWAGPGLLATYHDERHAAALENLAVTTATMRFLIPPDEPAAEHRRDVLHRAESDPAARRRVDSGRLAEPFWYDASPLTTRSADHPCEGRPPRGSVPAPGPGVLLPDTPVTVDGQSTRLRAVARDGLLALVGADAGTVRIDAPGPVRVLPVDDALAATLGARPDETWLVRPDAYVSAVVTDPDALETAVRKTLGASLQPAH